jgi:mono/diheme cytochrome c family protein
MNAQRFAAWAAGALFAAAAAVAAMAQNKPAAADVEAGRALALLACTGCHVVTADQPFRPIYAGPPKPPDFKEIAARCNTTAASLQAHLDLLPAVPDKAHMPNLVLSKEELRDVAAFIVSLRGKPSAPAQ